MEVEVYVDVEIEVEVVEVDVEDEAHVELHALVSARSVAVASSHAASKTSVHHVIVSRNLQQT